MQSVRSRILTAILIVCAITATQRYTLAGPTLVDRIGLLPDDVDMVLAAEDLAGIRATPLGDGATALLQTGMLIGGGNQSETMKAWRSLSERLGLPEEKAFDMLLGKRLVYTSRLKDNGKNDWLMISRTSVNTAKLVRRKLDVAPREIKHKRVLMTLEGGAYSLASRIDQDQDNAWLLLAPTSDDGLFNQITNADNQGHNWMPLRNLIALQEIEALGECDLIVYKSLGAKPGDGWLGLVASAKGDSVSFEIVSDHGKPLPAVAAHPTTLFDELRDGALFAHVELLPTSEDIIEDKLHDDLDQSDSGSVLAVMRRLLELPREMLGDDLNLILGNRMALGVYPKADGRGVSCGVGMEASDVRAMAIPGDAAMRPVTDSIKAFYGARETSFSFVGTLPRAVRSITLMPKEHGGALPPFGDQVEITWSYRDSPEHAPAGWWIAGTDRQAFRQTVSALTGLIENDEAADTGNWLMLIESRPAEMLKAFETGGMRTGDWLRGLTAVESFQIRTWAESTDDGDRIRGTGSIRLTEPVKAAKRR